MVAAVLVLGAGGSGANSRLTYSSYGGGMSSNAESGHGTAIIEPNRLIFGGGGGGGGTIMATYSSWYVPVGSPGCGGPGAGGGGMGNYSGSTGAYLPSGPGGMLGGGGGASAYMMEPSAVTLVEAADQGINTMVTAAKD